MVHELAEYERAPEQCHLTEEQLNAGLFGPSPALFGHVVTDRADQPHGFALWFLNYSTWDGAHGIYLEDLYVRPDARGSGAGVALLSTLAAICVERGYTRLQWSVLDWNETALRVYRRVGAEPLDEWTVHRVTGEALHRLARPQPRPHPGDSLPGDQGEMVAL